MFQRLFAAFLACTVISAAHAGIPSEVQARFETVANRFAHPDKIKPAADEDYDSSAFPGIYEIRLSARNGTPAPLVGMPMLMFDSDAHWLLNFDPTVNATPGNYLAHWNVGETTQWKGWEHAAPQGVVNQQLLRAFPVDRLIHQGSDDPVFIYYSAPDCPYCRHDQRAMEQSPYSFAIMPVTLDPASMPYVEHLACEDEPLAAWNRLMRDGKGSTAPCTRFDRNAWWDIKQVFFERALTPSFLFVDGTVIQGDVAAAMRKAADMKAHGAVFH